MTPTVRLIWQRRKRNLGYPCGPMSHASPDVSHSRDAQAAPVTCTGVRPQYKIALVAMLTFCLIIRKRDH